MAILVVGGHIEVNMDKVGQEVLLFLDTTHKILQDFIRILTVAIRMTTLPVLMGVPYGRSDLRIQ